MSVVDHTVEASEHTATALSRDAAGRHRSTGARSEERQPRGSRTRASKEPTTIASPADREKSLEAALAQIDRQFGKGSVMRLGSEDRAPVEVIPTGSIALDIALGI